jgi:hypothetical protein
METTRNNETGQASAGGSRAAWIARAVTAAQTGPRDDLRRMLAHRLTEAPGEGSPPLEADEPAAGAIILSLYGRLQDGPPDALGYFRRTLAELTADALPHCDADPGDLFRQASLLAAACGVHQDRPAAEALAERLLGRLQSRVAADFPTLLHSDGGQGYLWLEVFDTWVALSPPWRPGAPACPLVTPLEQFLGSFPRDGAPLGDAAISWAALALRALIKRAPQQAAAVGMPMLNRLLSFKDGPTRHALKAARAFFRDYRRVFDAPENLSWRQEFIRRIRPEDCRAALEEWRRTTRPAPPDWLAEMESNNIVHLDDHRPLNPVNTPPRSAGKSASL